MRADLGVSTGRDQGYPVQAPLTPVRAFAIALNHKLYVAERNRSGEGIAHLSPAIHCTAVTLPSLVRSYSEAYRGIMTTVIVPLERRLSGSNPGCPFPRD